MKVSIKEHPVRVFERHGSLLGKTGEQLPAGTEIEVGPPTTVVFDHRDQQGAEVLEGGHKGRWIILTEIEEQPWHLALGHGD